MDSRNDTISYRVEVSGWDASENFFVEKTTLDWDRETRQEVSLRSILREGCVLFVRLLHPLDNTDNFPIAYQAVKVTAKGRSGWSRVRLAQLRPHATHRVIENARINSTIEKEHSSDEACVAGATVRH